MLLRLGVLKKSREVGVRVVWYLLNIRHTSPRLLGSTCVSFQNYYAVGVNDYAPPIWEVVLVLKVTATLSS